MATKLSFFTLGGQTDYETYLKHQLLWCRAVSSLLQVRKDERNKLERGMGRVEAWFKNADFTLGHTLFVLFSKKMS